MLGHFTDTTTSPRIHLHTLDVQPERAWVERRFIRTATFDNTHHFYGVLLLQKHSEGLVHDATLQCAYIALVSLCEDRLRDEEVLQLVWEDIHLEFDGARRRRVALGLDHDERASLDDLWRLGHLRTRLSVQLD